MSYPPPRGLYRNEEPPRRRYQNDDLFDYKTKYENDNSYESKSILNLPSFSNRDDKYDEKKNDKKIHSSRWSSTKVYIPGLTTHIPYGLTQEEFDAFLIRARLDEVNSRLASEIIIDTPEIRSPSPESIYDNRGKRTNTRDQRIRKALLQERDELYERALQKFPNFRPPSEIKTEPKKLTKKIYIPYDKYPEYNFVGLIIGPRGVTQKKMERESRAKIAIRGKGSIKYGKDKLKKQEGDDDNLHVYIAADNDKSLKMASDMVEKLLIPVEEGKNELKRDQLRELARIHGTLRDDLANAGSSVVVDDSSMFDSLGMGTYVPNQQVDDAYEEFRNIIQGGGSVATQAPKKQEDSSNPYAMYPQFMQWSQEPKPGELPPIIPTIFNLWPTLPIPPGLPDKHPWDEPRERDRDGYQQ
jgi:hypothetical protein